MFAMMALAAAVQAGAAGTTFRKADGALVIENGVVSLAFDVSTGALTSLRNRATGGEYLKDPGGDGNPFRAYVDTTEVPKVLQLGFPWPMQPPEDAMGGTLVDPRSCRLAQHAFRRTGRGGQLKLVSQHGGTGLEFELTVRLPDGDVAADLDLTVRNTGKTPRRIMAAVPYLTGLGLGADRAGNLGVRLVGFGQARGAAWDNIGELYGRMWSGQWNAVYEPAADEALGVIARDKDLRTKVVRRFPGGGMSVFYADGSPLAPGATVTYPTAQVLVYKGDWKPTARRYGAWFSSTFKVRGHAKWLDDVDQFVGPWIPSPAAVAEARRNPDSPGAFTAFDQLPRLYLPDTYDLKEWAQWWQGVVVHNRYDAYHHTDGLYDLREDLGGLPAFARGVARVEKVGRVVGLYIASKTVRNDSRIFQRDFAGSRLEDWLLMETPGAGLPGPDKDGQLSFYMCPRYGPWQDHLARLCGDLLRETGARYIRLDELGETFVTCHNPKHRHANPYAATSDMLELLRKVRAAMNKIDPQAALYTEGAADLMQIYTDGTLAMWNSGPAIAPLRVAHPRFLGLSYGLGQVECALQGYVTASPAALSGAGWWNPHHGGLWGSGLVKRPPNYPAEGEPGPNLRWHELGHSFVDAVRRGDVADGDPVGVGQKPDEWGGRIWRARDYWVMVAGDLAARKPSQPVQVRIPSLPADVTGAYEIDMATLALRDAHLARTPDGGATVTLTGGFSAVLLPTPKCPPLLQMDDPAPLRPGAPVDVKLTVFAPWRSDTGSLAMTVSAPGLDARPTRVPPSGTVRLSARSGAEPGWYKVVVTGQCLPLKRWVRLER